MKERYGARNPRSWMMRFHSQTAGVTLTAQQPMNNVVRVAYQALAAVLGGTQSLHTNSMDETLALPTEQAVQVALRTQQVLAYESGVPGVLDPLGGSYYVEALTDNLEREAESLFAEIDKVGGVVKGLESGWLQRRIAQSAARQQWEIEQHRRVIVGVNEFVTEEPELTIPILKVGEEVEREQRERMARMRAERDNERCTRALDRLREAARGTENTMPYILEAARAYCTLYEIRAALEEVFGAYREPVFF
jgi:methylmalonyl-CoA mutase N-terminal domain/subunit